MYSNIQTYEVIFMDISIKKAEEIQKKIITGEEIPEEEAKEYIQNYMFRHQGIEIYNKIMEGDIDIPEEIGKELYKIFYIYSLPNPTPNAISLEYKGEPERRAKNIAEKCGWDEEEVIKLQQSAAERFEREKLYDQVWLLR